MGWLDLATNAPAKFSASGMPDAPKPLEGIFVRSDAAPLSEETAAANTLRTYEVRSVTPASIAADPPRQTLRANLLRSGYVPGSAGDRAFIAAHGGVNVYDDPALSHAENEEIFRATNIRRQRLSTSTSETYDGNIREEDEALAADIVELMQVYGCTSLDETIAGLERVQSDCGISLREAVTAGIRAAARANAPEGGVEKSVRSPRPEGTVKAAPSHASGGTRPNNAFKPTGKKKKTTDGISTAPTTSDKVHEEAVQSACEMLRRGAA
jgi:hypothetical protein